MSHFSVLTYNIHKGFSFRNKQFTLPQLKKALEKLQSHLIFLQEVQGEHHQKESYIEGWPEESQFEFLADQLWPHYAYGKNAVYQKGHHGNAILSQYPFESWENINVSHWKFASRSLLHGALQFPDGTPLHTICVHLGLFETERRFQLKMLCDRINQHIPDEEPLIIAGDFNDWRGKASSFMEEQLGLSEVFKVLNQRHAKSFPAWKPMLSVDRIYFRNLELHSAEVLTQKPWSRLSDHLPLYAHFFEP